MHKIYWYGFKRQLNEFYIILRSGNIITCDVDEFFSHFTGKKLAIEDDYASKIKWQGSLDLMQSVISHLAGKRFLQNEDTDLKIFRSHFRIADGLPASKQKPFLKKLALLFPETSGYRCKERLYYKARNKEPISKLLSDLKISRK